MRSTLYLGLFLTGLGTAALATACGGSTEGTGGGGGETSTNSGTTSGTTSGTNSTGTTSQTSSTGTTSSTISTGSTTTGNNGCAGTFATAQDITLNDQTPTACQLNKPDADAGFFKFTGTKGQAVIIATSAKVGTDPFDTTYLDTVVTVYDSQMNQIAQNDDPTPRYSNDAEVWTILPADGEYVFSVRECNAVFPGNCADAALITTFDYEVSVFETDSSAPVVTGEIVSGSAPTDVPNDASTPASLPAIKYEFGTTGYYLSKVFGVFHTATDVDVYSFTVPSDIEVNAGGRAIMNFGAFPAGTDGNGSTSSVGKMWIVDPADLTHKVAEVDVSVGSTPGDIGAPIKTLGNELYLFVTKPAGALGGNDFYVINHYGGGSNPVELANATNGVAATAEALDDSGGADFLATYFVDGNLTPAATDVDFYSVAVPAGAATISVACGAQRSGSGLRGMKFEVVKADGSSLSPKAEGIDAADEDVFIDKAAVPSGASTLLIKIHGATQDAVVTSDFYRCGVRFQ